MTLNLTDDNILLAFMLKLNSKVLTLLLILTLSLTDLSPTFADDQLNLPSTTINPGSFYYPLKRLWEKGSEKLQFSNDSKISFIQSQLKTRLAELNYVVEKKLLSEVQTSSQRFAYSAGILTKELIKQNNSNEKEKVTKEFEKYSKFLEQLRDKYAANTSFWMLIQHDINSLKILSDQLK